MPLFEHQEGLWWVELGWTPGAHQSCSVTPTSSAGQGRENIMKRLVGQRKDRDITQ